MHGIDRGRSDETVGSINDCQDKIIHLAVHFVLAASRISGHLFGGDRKAFGHKTDYFWLGGGLLAWGVVGLVHLEKVTSGSPREGWFVQVRVWSPEMLRKPGSSSNQQPLAVISLLNLAGRRQTPFNLELQFLKNKPEIHFLEKVGLCQFQGTKSFLTIIDCLSKVA